MKMILIGYKRFVSKKGNDTCIAHVVMDFNEREKRNGCVGSKCEDIFMPDNQLDYLKSEHVGCEFVPTYGPGSYGKPEVVRVEIKK